MFDIFIITLKCFAPTSITNCYYINYVSRIVKHQDCNLIATFTHHSTLNTYSIPHHHPIKPLPQIHRAIIGPRCIRRGNDLRCPGRCEIRIILIKYLILHRPGDGFQFNITLGKNSDTDKKSAKVGI